MLIKSLKELLHEHLINVYLKMTENESYTCTHCFCFLAEQMVLYPLCMTKIHV